MLFSNDGEIIDSQCEEGDPEGWDPYTEDLSAHEASALAQIARKAGHVIDAVVTLPGRLKDKSVDILDQIARSFGADQ